MFSPLVYFLSAQAPFLLCIDTVHAEMLNAVPYRNVYVHVYIYYSFEKSITTKWSKTDLTHIPTYPDRCDFFLQQK